MSLKRQPVLRCTIIGGRVSLHFYHLLGGFDGVLSMSFASRDPEREAGCGTPEINERIAGLSHAPGERLHLFQGTTLDCSRVVKKVSKRGWVTGNPLGRMKRRDSDNASGVNTTGSRIFLFYRYSCGRITDTTQRSPRRIEVPVPMCEHNN